jgi:UDP-2,4-diacetamido-2,4,6-trideoxy-beta-L-altropyranose hydrolase
MKHLLIRADANARIGNGHVMRCLALAQHWQLSGKATMIGYCESDLLRQCIETSGVEFVQLDRSYPDPGDVPATLSLASQITESAPTGKPWIVLDGYNFDAHYQFAIKSAGYRVLVIDDMAHLDRYHADILLNQNIAAETLSYNCDATTSFLLGSRFCLLRDEFVRAPHSARRIAPVARKILISMGGADPDNVTAKVLDALAKLDIDQLEASVVVGSSNNHFEELRRTVDSLSRPVADESTPVVRLVHNSQNMRGLMEWADSAVTNAGSTCYELALMGLPAVVLILADNQQIVARGLAAAAAVTNLGWFRGIDSTHLANALSQQCKNYERRVQQSRCGQQLVDGRGASRVVSAIREAAARFDTTLQVRPATLADAEPLWELANEETVRNNSFSPNPIPLPAHIDWLKSKLASRDSRIWIIEREGEFAAQIRYDRVAGSLAEIDFSVRSLFRGRGLGTSALLLTRRCACEQLAVTRVRGIVMDRNPASARAFVGAGFELSGKRQVNQCSCSVFDWSP